MNIPDLFSVKGKKVLITGGGSGIGKMFAEGLVANGAHVIVASRDLEKCENTASKLNNNMANHGGKCYGIGADLSTYEGCEKLAHEASNIFGGELHGLINNTGKGWSQPLGEYNPKKFDDIISLNVTAGFHLMQKCLPMLEKVGTPESPSSVINVGSVDGLKTPGIGNQSYSYSTSKTALMALTKHLALQLGARNVTVNLIAPGPFYTKGFALNSIPAYQEMKQAEAEGREVGQGKAEKRLINAIAKSNPLKRLGQSFDAQGAVIFLMSKAGSFVNGAILNLDGGSYIGSAM